MKNKRIMTAVIAVVILIVMIPATLSWFYHQKSIRTVTLINDPNALKIGAKNRSEIRELVVGPVDVTTGSVNYKDVVFCVYGYKSSDYYLQLAHTTNIGFKYTIYPATTEALSGYTHVTYLENEYYFDPGSETIGVYLNKQDSGNHDIALKTGQYHDATYANDNGSYDRVQKNAEPLYWRTSHKESLKSTSNGLYINYYVLRISWDGNNLTNNKETDMVYLMADGSL